MTYENKQELYEFEIAGASGAAPNDGFIDNLKYQQRIALENIAWPAGTLGLRKSRANFRWTRLGNDVNALGAKITFVDPVDATSALPATIFKLQIIVPTWVRTLDENNLGDELFGIDAVKRVMARVLIETNTQKIEWINGGTGGVGGLGEKGPTNSIETIGYVYSTLNAAESAISETLLGYV
jgi:hypothetical protein